MVNQVGQADPPLEKFMPAAGRDHDDILDDRVGDEGAVADVHAVVVAVAAELRPLEIEAVEDVPPGEVEGGVRGEDVLVGRRPADRQLYRH